MAAPRYHVDNLTGIVDRNRVQATGPTREIFDIPEIERKWEAFGWHVFTANGHDVAQILEALDAAERVKGQPSVIVADTVKGKDISFAEHNAAFHNGSFTEDQYRQAMAELETRRAELENN